LKRLILLTLSFSVFDICHFPAKTVPEIRKMLWKKFGRIQNALLLAFAIAKKKTIGFMLVHLSSHLGYHLGQINYLRRMFEKGA
jgi:hypothetical protein